MQANFGRGPIWQNRGSKIGFACTLGHFDFGQNPDLDLNRGSDFLTGGVQAKSTILGNPILAKRGQKWSLPGHFGRSLADRYPL